MKTYYIEIEGQCSMVLALIKVEAENEEEAKLKALKALHATEDIYSITQDEAQNLIDSGEIEYMLDEDGCEIGIDDEEEDTDKYMLYMQDESGFETTYVINSQDEAIAEAIRIWDDGEGGFCKVAVHQLRQEQDVDDMSEQNRIWYAQH